MQLPEGRTIDVRDLGSLKPAFKEGESKCGVYRLHFENGEAYPGKSKNVVGRFARHRRTWPDIVAIDFFPLPEDEITEAERFLITETEVQYPVRNRLLTNRPRGNGPVEIQTTKGSTVALPWEAERKKAAYQSIADEGEPRLARLLAHPLFPTLRTILGWYLSQTVPDPAATAGQLWTVTAFPSTNRSASHHRLLTLSCGNLETFYVEADRRSSGVAEDFYFTIRINTKLMNELERFRDPERVPRHGFRPVNTSDVVPRWGVVQGKYREEQVSRFWFTPENLSQIVTGAIEYPEIDELLASAYELNVRLMRRGSSMYSKNHNGKLADLLVAEAVVSDAANNQ